METFNNVINSGQLVLVDFFATWCQPCKAMHPILEQVKSVLGDHIRIIKVDVDKYGVTASQYRIQSVPTLMLFRNGEVLWRTSGMVDKAELLATLDPFLILSKIYKNNRMRIIGNLLWWLFGGLEAAIGYFTGSLALACTIIGIPFAIQTFKIGLLCLWPFGSTVRESNSPTGCIRIPLNLLWLIFGGLWACLMHLFFGFLLCITIIGIPWGKQHFKMAALSLAPFGKDVELGF